MDIVIRAAVVFAFLFLLMRMLGRRELSSMEPFDIILLVVIGDLVQQGVTQSDYSVTGALLAVSTIALLTVLVSWTSLRVRRLRPILAGEPIVLVEDGEVVERNLRRQRLTSRRSNRRRGWSRSARSGRSAGRSSRPTAGSASSRRGNRKRFPRGGRWVDPMDADLERLPGTPAAAGA